MADTTQVVVGRVGRAHGLRGEVAVELRTDEPDLRFAPGAVLAAARPGGGPPYPHPTLSVAAVRWHQSRLLVRFAELVDRTAAEAARDVELTASVEVQQRPADPEEYYDHQLVGLAVVTADGREHGSIAEVLHHGAQDLLVVRRPAGEDALVPFVTALVPEVDLGAGRVVVADLPGLLDPGD